MKKIGSMAILALLAGLLGSCAATPPAAFVGHLNAGENESIVEVQRSRNFVGSAVAMRIFVNGQEKGSVGNGQFTSFVLPNGRHTIRVQNATFAGQNREMVFDANSQRITFSAGFDQGFHLRVTNAVALGPAPSAPATRTAPAAGSADAEM